VNNFKLALTMVLLKIRKDVKLTTLGGRLFQGQQRAHFRPDVQLVLERGLILDHVCSCHAMI